jgi:hypothetical protein
MCVWMVASEPTPCNGHDRRETVTGAGLSRDSDMISELYQALLLDRRD